MWKLFSIFLFLPTPQPFAQVATRGEADQATIVNLENAWNQAVQLKDLPGLQMLLGTELAYIDYDGRLMDKAQYLASVEGPSLHPAHIVSEFMSVHFYGATALVNGVYRENGVRDGKPYSLHERFTDVWVHRSDTWVCVASHSTLITH